MMKVLIILGLEWQDLDRWHTSFDTPKCQKIMFKIDEGKLVGRNIGDGSRPKSQKHLKLMLRI